MKKNKLSLTEHPVEKTILKMAGGMLFGFIAMSAFFKETSPTAKKIR